MTCLTNSRRATVNCYVFGAAGVGKSGLIKALAGRRLDDGPTSSSSSNSATAPSSTAAAAAAAATAGAGAAAGTGPSSRAAGAGSDGGGEGGEASSGAGVSSGAGGRESVGLLASGHVLVDGEPRALVLTEVGA